MAYNIGIDMLALGQEDRNTLMKGVVIRRFPPGGSLNKEQLEIALTSDLEAIQKRVPSFSMEEYVGVDGATFYSDMVDSGLLAEAEDGENPPIISVTDDGNALIEGMDEDMEWTLEMVPMSTRGIFDRLKVMPDTVISLTPEEFEEECLGEGKQVVVDDSLGVKDKEEEEDGEKEEDK